MSSCSKGVLIGGTTCQITTSLEQEEVAALIRLTKPSAQQRSRPDVPIDMGVAIEHRQTFDPVEGSGNRPVDHSLPIGPKGPRITHPTPSKSTVGVTAICSFIQVGSPIRGLLFSYDHKLIIGKHPEKLKSIGWVPTVLWLGEACAYGAKALEAMMSKKSEDQRLGKLLAGDPLFPTPFHVPPPTSHPPFHFSHPTSLVGRPNPCEARIYASCEVVVLNGAKQGNGAKHQKAAVEYC